MIFERPFLAQASATGFGPPVAPVLDGLSQFLPVLPDCWNHLGDALFQQRRPDAALACYAEALRRGGDPAARGERRWMAWMLLGRFERAWQVSDDLELIHRARHGGASCHMWDGSPPDGRAVFVRCLHGLGDTLQFIRFIPLLAPRCRSLIVQGQRELWPLLSKVEGIVDLVPSWEVLPEGLDYDLEIEVMELPYLFRSTAASLPCHVPYLRVDPALVAAKRHLVERVEGGMRSRRLTGPSHLDGGIPRRLNIGLVWASSRWNPTRSVPLNLFSELACLPGVRLFSLQWGDEREELLARPDLPIVDLGDHTRTIEETAAALMNLDLIICPDTMVAHLAGALGHPVWVMLLHHADWRWLAACERSPWYPTMRLFRQARPGDWDSVVTRVTAEIRSLAPSP